MTTNPGHDNAPALQNPEAAFRAALIEAYKRAPFQFDHQAEEYGQLPLDGHLGPADQKAEADDRDESILRFEGSILTPPTVYKGNIMGHDEFTLSLCAIRGGPRSILEAEFSGAPLVVTTYIGFPDEPGEGSMARVFMAPELPPVAVRMCDLFDAQERSFAADGTYLNWDFPPILNFVDRDKIELLSPEACLALGRAVAAADAKIEVHHYEPQQNQVEEY